jgi:hypothetical protein
MSELSKIISVCLLVIVCQISVVGIFLAPKVHAAGADVNLSVTVLPRPATDTINDFDFSKINPNGQGKVYLQ